MSIDLFEAGSIKFVVLLSEANQCAMADVDVPREGQTEEYSPGNTGTIRRVPGNILGFLTSRIAEYLARAADISAEIHECPGQPTKLVLYGGIKGQ